MRLDFDREPLTADDDTIRSGVSEIPLPPLLASVAHLTGELDLMPEDLVPNLDAILDPNNGYTEQQLIEGRERAAQALIRFRDRGGVAAPAPDETQIVRMVTWLGGGKVVPEQIPIFEEELALDGTDLRAPDWRIDDITRDRTFHVVVVGAGMSGIVVAHRLRQAGVTVTILDKNEEVGGTWLENSYPGCRVDIQSHFYCYSFAQSREWPQFNSTQPVLLDYFCSVVDHLGLRPQIRLRTSVDELRWDEVAQEWEVRTSGASGSETLRAHAVVSAVGQLNRPKFPDIAGIDDFEGVSFHSARWDHSVDFTGKRIGVIGTGASAVQFIPYLAASARSLRVHQRTPPWLLPVPNYQQDLPATQRWFQRHVPDYVRWDRLWNVVRTQEGLLPFTEVDPGWDGGGESTGASNALMREMLGLYLDAAFPDVETRAKVQPHYPPLAKRAVLDDGAYPAALAQPNVTLDVDPIECITPSGVRMADGSEHEYDVIVYGTGFAASSFLTPMRVSGRGGVDLHQRWNGDARAYVGITVPEFPNLFLMYGPNTNIVINGSIIYFSECEATYVTECVRLLLEAGASAMECRPDAHDRYNERIDAGNLRRAWGAASVNTWYRNEKGRIAQNWPFNLYEYWIQTRGPDPADYLLTSVL